MTALTAGRIYQILQAIDEQQWQTAANLIHNSPGLNWQQYTSDAAIAAIEAMPLPVTTNYQARMG